MKFKLLTVLLMFVFAFSAFAADKPVAQKITETKQMTIDEKQIPDTYSDYKMVGDMKVKRNTNYKMPKATFLSEGFEGDFPPTGWFLFTDGADWQQTTAQANSGTYSAFHDDDNITELAGDWIITPAIDLTGSVDARMTFFQYQYYASYYEYHGIFVITDTTGFAGDTTGLDMIYEGVGTSSVWEQITTDLSAYDGQTIYIGFYYFGDYSDEWYIDDVVVEDAPTAPVMTMLLEELTAPPTPIDSTISDTFAILINAGGGDLNISDVSSDNSDLSLTPLETVIAPGDTMFAIGQFSPTSSGLITGEIIVQGDDPDNSADTIAVSGIGFDITRYEFDDVEVYPYTQYRWSINNANGDAYPHYWLWYVNVLEEGNHAFGITYASAGNDDYLITPPLPILDGDFISFDSWAISSFYPETWQVLVSTTDTDPASFTVGLDTVTSGSTDPVNYFYDLSAYAGQTIYVAIRNVSVDMYYQFVDNVLMPTPIYPAFGDLNGTVTDTFMVAIEGALVTIAETELSDTSSATGYYKIDTIASGTYTVNVSAYGFEDASDEATIEDGQWTNLDFALTQLPIGWSNLQWPFEITILAGEETGNVYGQVWIDGITDPEGPAEGIVAELGIGDAGTDPLTDESWNWHAAAFNTQSGNNDEFMASVTMNDTGSYSYCYRYSLLGGPWSYGYNEGAMGDLTVLPVVKINEVYYDGPGSDVHTFTELYGTPGMSLDGYHLIGINGNNGDQTTDIDLAGLVMPDDGFFVIAEDDGVENYDLIATGVDFQNGPDNVILVNGVDTVDALGYGSFDPDEFFVGEGEPAMDVYAGISLNRYPDGVDTDNNAVDFNAAYPTSGEANNEPVPIISGSTSIDFGEVDTDATDTYSLNVYNNGGDTLIITAVSSSNAVFTVDEYDSTIYVAPGGSATLHVNFAPTEEITYADSLTIFNNDPADSERKIYVGGIGTDPLLIFFDDFEAYTAGTQLVLQNPTDWETWGGTPGGDDDPFVSDAYAYSGSNSVVIAYNDDLVKDFGPLTSGAYSMSFQVYIPDGKAGYFNALSEFTQPGTFEWGMECYFDVGGGGRVLGGSSTAIPFSYTYDTWHMVEVVVDLDHDLAELRFNGTSIHEWQWTLGASGDGSQLQLDANDFFGATANDEMYFDDYMIAITDSLIVGIEDNLPEIPKVFALSQNYPNPFNPTTTINFQLPKASDVRITIYNAMGQKVRTLVTGQMQAGSQHVVWDAKNDYGVQVSSGIYFYRMTAGKFTKSMKMLLLK